MPCVSCPFCQAKLCIHVLGDIFHQQHYVICRIYPALRLNFLGSFLQNFFHKEPLYCGLNLILIFSAFLVFCLMQHVDLTETSGAGLLSEMSVAEVWSTLNHFMSSFVRGR